MPTLKAPTRDAGDVLATSLAIVFHDKRICCGKDSALEDRLPQSDPVSLTEVASKIQGKQLLSDGSPVLVTAEYHAADAVNSGGVITSLTGQRASLLQWNSRLYVLYGAIYDQAVYSDGSITYVIRKLLLLDTRFSDSRREVTFNRDRDDLSKVQGVLFVQAARQ